MHVAPGFYVYIDEGDDPPVYHDEEGLVSVSYSNFVFDLVAAQRLRGQHLSASGPVPDDGKLASLALRRGPVTRTDALVIHRFYGPHEYATVRWAPGDRERRVEPGGRLRAGARRPARDDRPRRGRPATRADAQAGAAASA